MSTAVLFGDFFSPDDYGVRKIYRPMQDYNKLAQILEEYYMKLHMGNSQVIASSRTSNILFDGYQLCSLICEMSVL